MKDLGEVLNKINETYDSYEKLQLKQTSDQCELLRRFSCYYHDIGLHLDRAEEQWQTKYDNFEHKVHARKEAYADSTVPEYKMLKRTYTRLEAIQKSIGSTLKYG